MAQPIRMLVKSFMMIDKTEWSEYSIKPSDEMYQWAQLLQDAKGLNQLIFGAFNLYTFYYLAKIDPEPVAMPTNREELHNRAAKLISKSVSFSGQNSAVEMYYNKDDRDPVLSWRFPRCSS